MNRVDADVIVIGGGPAGIAAVCRLAAAGRRTVWIDQAARPGGQIWRAGAPPAWGQALQQVLPQIDQLPGHAVIAAEDEGRELLLQNLHDPARPPLRVRAPQLLLATGARERFLPFPGWTLPGVHGAGGLQALVKGGWPIDGRRVVLAGSGPLLLAAAQTAKAAGAEVLLIAEQAPRAALNRFALGLPAAKLRQAAALRWALRDVPYRPGRWVVQALGEGRLEAILLDDGTRIGCDALGIGHGLLPNAVLGSAIGCRLDASGAIIVDEAQRSSLPHVLAAGECCGIGGVDKALAEGEIAALSLLGDAIPPALRRRHRQALGFADRLAETFGPRAELLQVADAGTIVCRCEDVSLGQLRGHANWREARLQTRCGMGACQGRVCRPIASELLGWRSDERARAPLQPVPLRALMTIRPSAPPPEAP